MRTLLSLMVHLIVAPGVFFRARVRNARALWSDAVALGVFLAFISGLALLLSPLFPLAPTATLREAYAGELVMLGAIFIALVLYAICVPLYGGLVTTLVYGAFTLLSFLHQPAQPVSIGFWIFWMFFAVRGTYVRIAKIKGLEDNWERLLRFQQHAQLITPFYLVRIEDVSGVSGTGKVAEGVIFSNNEVALTWTTAQGIITTSIYRSIVDVERVHGHEGRTIVVWADEDGTLIGDPHARAPLPVSP